ncbi:MAG: phosphatase PAP2 family protein [Bacteroidales bacterium]|jgi:acid phosphatase (class A)|nr:phosphatase PAP2 family protein [Bacteroidales bacterium]
MQLKKIFLALLILQISSALQAQQPWLMPADMPNAVKFLPPPPDSGSAAFLYDLSQYQWGKAQRNDAERLAIAVRDANWSVRTICQEFSVPFGMKISEETTPEIYHLLEMALITTDQVGKKPKEHYSRVRPYVRFNEPTIAPGDEEALRHNGSFPSGHTILGWSAALLLTEINPAAADTILARGYMFGQSRVIAGYHWQSDVDAGRLAASAAVARIHADKRFAKQMRRAKKEFRRLSKKMN